MNIAQRLVELTRNVDGEITIGVAKKVIRYQAKEESVRDLYVWQYPQRSSSFLCDSDEWAKFARWVDTHKDLPTLRRFAAEACTNPAGDHADVKALQKDLQVALDRVDSEEGIGGTVHRIGKELMDAAGETVEGIAVSDQNEEA